MSRRGMVLGVVILTSVVLSIFLFAYNRTVRQQNIRAHHERIAEVAMRLALTGTNLLAEQMASSLDTTINNAASCLKTVMVAPPSPAPAPRVTIDSSDISGSVMETIKNDFDAYLQQLSDLNPRPRCTKMEMAFEDIRQTTPSADDVQLQAGRDPVEKLGEMVISCTVEFQTLLRRASIRRQFRVVNMVPGIFSRFSLFVPFTPWYNSYNSLGVRYSGSIDPSYKHPFPPTTPLLSYGAPLKVFNGTETVVLTPNPDARNDLQNHGWIFLGPSHNTAATDAVLLKIPSGYKPDAGGHFQVALPPGVGNGKELIPPENIDDASNFNLPSPYATAACMVGGMYQGFFTDELDAAGNSINPLGAAGQGLWPSLTPNASKRYECAASWLFPFGDRTRPSRTLMIGPVLAGLLKFYFLKDMTTTPAAWKLTIRGKGAPSAAVASYSPNAQVENANGVTPAESPICSQLCKQPTGGADAGYDSYKKIMPVDFTPNTFSNPPSVGISYNVLFDFMAYPGGSSPYPNVNGGSTVMQNTGDPFYVPCYDTINNPPVSGTILGLHPYDGVMIQFQKAAMAVDNTYFKGDLTKFRIANNNLLARVTHIIDLSSCANQASEDAAFASHLFRPADPAIEPAYNGYFKPRKKGIFYVKRRSGVIPGGDKLTLPAGSGIYVNQNFIIIIDKGDILIPQKIKADSLNNAPGKLFSLVALEGNIYLGTNSEIDAYLVALNPGPGSLAGGGRLLCANATKEMNIFGGVAAWEMGLYETNTDPTTMSTFSNGGEIHYNPRFNPSSPLYLNALEFIPEDIASAIEITGAE
ncbi:MAG: hypothetical protein HQM09_12475 [Candidatus Riflebacteria bacterium]|nr:hypothetical protein [Candidatus Riflebacteria bacterium]